MAYPFKLGVITDEVSQNIFEAAEFAGRHELDCLEVRSVNGHGPFEYTEEDIEDIISASTAYALPICAVSSPLFKCDFSDRDTVKAHLHRFEACAVMAKRIGAELIRGFDFWESGVPLEARAAVYDGIAGICEQYGVVCVIESDPSVHSNTPHKLVPLIEKINEPYVKALYDPGNEIWVTGKTDTAAYDTLAPHIAHVHIKDGTVTENGPQAVKIGTGLADFETIFKKLIADGYTGAVVLETHYRKTADLTEEQLKNPGGSTFSDGAEEASEESILELKRIIKNCMEALS